MYVTKQLKKKCSHNAVITEQLIINTIITTGESEYYEDANPVSKDLYIFCVYFFFIDD